MAEYVINLDKLEATAKIAKANADALGVHLLMALKGFPLPAAFPTLAPYLEGVTASGLFEARLGKLMGKDVHVHAPAYAEDEIEALCETATHVVFNSLEQLRRFGVSAAARGRSIGLRVNPGFSSADCLKYDPCCPDSRFGVLLEELEALDEYERAALLASLDGIHIHALCEGYADDFAGMVEKFTEKFAPYLKELKWINLGGGEVVDDPSFASPRAIEAVRKLREKGTFEVYIEPSEYMVRESGWIRENVLDVIHREKDIVVLDISASCHATDLALFNMTPRVDKPAQVAHGRTTILGCVSCLAGDVIGEYTFAEPLQVGDVVEIGGLGCYSFAQQSWFNGIRHPDLVLESAKDGKRTVLSWTYADYLREFYQP